MIAVLCLAVSCAQHAPEFHSAEQGSLSITVKSSAVTRAATPGDGNIFRGGGMEDLTLVLVNSMGEISEIQRIASLAGDEQRIKRVTFVNLDVGNYMLYAYANTERSLLDEVNEMLSSLGVGDTFDAAYYDALFTTLSGRSTPVIDAEHPLLLTASKPLSVGVENSSTTIDLVRPVVWLDVRLYNHSDYPMQIDDVSFSNFNPSTSYILPKEGLIPSSVTYRALPLYSTYTGGTDVIVPPMSEGCIYEMALFENRASSYTMSLTLRAGEGDLEHVTSLSTTDTYALQNRSSGRYLVDNGNGRLAVVASLSGAQSREHALWRFSSQTSGYMENVATGNRFYRSTTASTSGSNLSFAFSSNGYFRMSYYNYSTYYLRDNNGSPTFSATSNTTRDWILQKVTQRVASMTDSQINVVDVETAAVTPMTEQLRNQHVQILINAYYNDVAGSFNFVVEPWSEKDEEVEFN